MKLAYRDYRYMPNQEFGPHNKPAIRRIEKLDGLNAFRAVYAPDDLVQYQTDLITSAALADFVLSPKAPGSLVNFIRFAQNVNPKARQEFGGMRSVDSVSWEEPLRFPHGSHTVQFNAVTTRSLSLDSVIFHAYVDLIGIHLTPGDSLSRSRVQEAVAALRPFGINLYNINYILKPGSNSKISLDLLSERGEISLRAVPTQDSNGKLKHNSSVGWIRTGENFAKLRRCFPQFWRLDLAAPFIRGSPTNLPAVQLSQRFSHILKAEFIEGALEARADSRDDRLSDYSLPTMNSLRYQDPKRVPFAEIQLNTDGDFTITNRHWTPIVISWRTVPPQELQHERERAAHP